MRSAIFSYNNHVRNKKQENNLNCEVLNVFNPTDAGTHTDMIHIEIPDTKTLVEKNDGTSRYIAYNMEINGWKHASVRFSHLYEFSELIRTKFGKKYKGPEFPSKKLFKLDAKSIEDRRIKIKKYFQALVQHPEIARHYLVEKQLLGFQVDSYRATSTNVSVDIYLGDGEKIQIKCNVGCNTSDVMKLIAEKLGFSTVEHLQWNFGLFIARSRDSIVSYSISPDTFDPLIVRLLRNFEAPYISLSTVNQKSFGDGLFHYLCLRKLIWDPKAEDVLLDNEQIVDLLYRQATQEMKLGHFGELKFEQESKLKTHKNDKIQFLRTCQQIPHYSYEKLGECSGDYPKAGMVSSIKIGHRQLVIKFTDDIGITTESIFRATRIRVWRLSKVVDDISFQFEYLRSKDNFEWITLNTPHAILLSLLLQSIGTEILYEHNNLSIEQQIAKEKESKGMFVEVDPTPVQPPRDPRKPIIILQNAVENTDPLGVMEHYRNYNRMFTTISDQIPTRDEATGNITNDDL
ncbi:unnamed protein product [Caenorhabditis angaria]|uniref:PX domain-containing protein n=1 Tax=Caenorhabditis angaria TaxID=860376 RepID=A0A9P1NAH6_9PELO|nr:unnamed protein product [Caenorhabditis angaria]